MGDIATLTKNSSMTNNSSSSSSQTSAASGPAYTGAPNSEQWRKQLTPEQYHVCWEKGTEQPYTGALLHNKRNGDYLCVCCKQVLFHSDAKFESDCGWPSFDRAIKGSVIFTEDTSHGMKRVEITCSKCGAHLGHVFPDGPTETGERYCVNSLSLDFAPKP